MVIASPPDPGDDFLSLIARYLKQQKQLNTVLMGEFNALTPFLTAAPKTNYSGWLAQVIALIRQYSFAAAALGGAAYTAYRVLVVPTGTKFTPPVVAQPNVEQMTRGLGWATRAVADGVAEDTINAGLSQARGVAQRLVTNTSRRALVQSVDEDDEAAGWYRIPSDPQACTFCRLMCIRGPVYKNERTAGRDANQKFVGEGEFKFHDHCECTAAPLFRKQRKPNQPSYVKTWDKEYTAATKHDPVDKLNAYRRVVEDRE